MGAAIVLALFLFRPGAARLKNRIANSIGGALQRQVEIGSVHVRLLPRPGFELEDFIVHDDPAFSAEPVLRAQEVTASLRVLALLRGRLEVSRLSLTEPSLNLVRNAEGHWNLEAVLEHARQTPAAPTGARGSAGRPAFPYIEADHGRINFKLGSEKKPFALTDADYSLWQDSDSSWGMRLKAHPLRTDFNLSDTGTVGVNGTWQRADSLRTTPVQFTMQWEQAQLGQVTKLFSGQDRGWRGAVHLNIDMTGTPADLTIDSRASLEDFRRYDILTGNALTLRTNCTARYSSIDRGFHDVDCSSPVGDGSISVTGNIARVLKPPQYDLAVQADQVPMPAVLALVRHMKLALPDDLRAGGAVIAVLHCFARGDGRNRTVVFNGAGHTEGLRLASLSNKTDLLLDRVPFTVVSGIPPTRPTGHGRSNFSRSEPDAAHVVIGPFRADHISPLNVQGWVSRQGYSFALTGDTTVQHLLQSARMLALPAPQPTADGAAKVDLQVAGNWSGFAAAKVTGSAQLKNVRIELRGLSGPVELGSAALSLKPDRVEVEGITASAAGSHWTGSLSMQRPCPTLPTCQVAFNLQADQFSTERFSKFVNPNADAPWYRFLTPEAHGSPPFLQRFNASGKFSTAVLAIHGLAVNHVTANVLVREGTLRISDLAGDTLGGQHRGQWEVDFTTKPPTYSGEGSFDHVVLAELASAMHNDWLSGVGSGTYQIKTSGGTVSELLREGSGSLRFDASDGLLKHVLVDNAPLHLRHFSGRLDLNAGEFTMQDAKLDSGAAAYTVSGTAFWSRALNFKLVRDQNSSLAVTGTLEDPRVSVVRSPATEAALKP